MVYKTPVIVTRKGGVSTIVKDGVNGILVRAKSSNEIAQKVNLLIENEKLRFKMGENAYRIVVHRFNWDRIGRRFYNLYNRSLQKNKL
jgi:glycosyltransferase involved in cell wall biosynthesis